MFSREQRLIRRHQKLKAEGHRSTPGILLKGEGRSFSIRSAPTEEEPFWRVFDGKLERKIKTEDIAELDAARWLAGYDY